MTHALYKEIETFLSFSPDDVSNLTALAPVMAKNGAAVTDHFYQVLGQNPTTAALIDGRVDQLKQTHTRWMKTLTTGSFDDAWYDAQVRIGHVHVAMGISPLHVELTFSLLRNELSKVVNNDVSDPTRAASLFRSLTKALDMSLALVNHAYAEERLNRLSAFTGFTRRLIENCINKKAK